MFQYLLRTALSSIERKEQLEGRTRELASLQVGLLGTVLQTLSLRDKMTARHSAAVARYSREIASELGLSEREQDVVHTAALLHDIGKFIFPDSILFADTKLTPADLEIVRRHPEQGARLVARIDGYGPGRRDHPRPPRANRRQRLPQRPDRRADPARRADHLRGGHVRRDDRRATPTASRSRRGRRSRSCGACPNKQLDADVVETFIALLEKRSVTFRHADDADFERELNLDRRVRDYAAPRAAAA